MKKITTPEAPLAIGPYSQAVESGDTIYVSGQIALDPNTGALSGHSVEEQLEIALGHLSSILNAADASLRDVVKVTIYLLDITKFANVNDIYAQFFDSHRPARAVVEVSRLPKDALVEIDAIATREG